MTDLDRVRKAAGAGAMQALDSINADLLEIFEALNEPLERLLAHLRTVDMTASQIQVYLHALVVVAVTQAD